MTFRCRFRLPDQDQATLDAVKTLRTVARVEDHEGDLLTIVIPDGGNPVAQVDVTIQRATETIPGVVWAYMTYSGSP